MSEHYRDQIKRHAAEALRDHVMAVKGVASVEKPALHDPKQTMQDLGPYVWRCHKPGTGQYSFYVAELPGAIVQYGDIGGLLITQGPAYNIAWLADAIRSQDYVLGKAHAQRNKFVEEDFNAYVREQGKDPSDFECYDDYVMQTGDGEGYANCHDWSADTLWAYWALHKFIELRHRAR